MPATPENSRSLPKNAFSKACSERLCPECGVSFTPTRPHQRFCSNSHRTVHWKRRQRTEDFLEVVDRSQPEKSRTFVVLGQDDEGKDFGVIVWRKS